MSEKREEERAPGQHPQVHEPADGTLEPDPHDTNEQADDRVEVHQPDGELAPEAPSDEPERGAH